MHVVEAEDVQQLVQDHGDIRAGAAGNPHDSDVSVADGGVTSGERLFDFNVSIKGRGEHFFESYTCFFM